MLIVHSLLCSIYDADCGLRAARGLARVPKGAWAETGAGVAVVLPAAPGFAGWGWGDISGAGGVRLGGLLLSQKRAVYVGGCPALMNAGCGCTCTCVVDTTSTTSARVRGG